MFGSHRGYREISWLTTTRNEVICMQSINPVQLGLSWFVESNVFLSVAFFLGTKCSHLTNLCRIRVLAVAPNWTTKQSQLDCPPGKRFFLECVTLQDATDRLPRTFGEHPPTYAASHPRRARSAEARNLTRYFSIPTSPVQLWCSASPFYGYRVIFPREQGSWCLKLTNRLHLLTRKKWTALYLHSHIQLNGVEFN